MSKSLLLAAAAVLAVSAAPAAVAQGGDSAQPAGAAQPPQLTPEQQADLRRAAQIQRAFSQALQAEQVSQQVKGALLLCLYNNKLSSLSQATNRVLANNPALKADDPTTIYRTAAGVCGVTFRPVNGADGPANGGPAPAPPADNSQGR
ncbi:MAG: hypothetical protein EOP02_29615 [Proteobacteria bacterium]|nr:MAG: hypothetical protein EOP02_29615 [Pseudomonadota bacterium]